MSQRKAKEYRQAMEQYRGAVEDVDDLKRRIGAMEARHRREDQLEEIRRRQARREAEQWEKKRKKSMEQARRIRAEERRRQLARRRIAVLIAGALVVVLLLALAIKAMTADTAAAEELEITATCGPVTLLTAEPDVWDGEGEDPREAEKIEKALLASGYFSMAVPMCYEYQDYMRTYCTAYECPYPLALAVAEVESHFNMEAVGAAGEVGIMQLNPGPDGAYHAELEAATGLDPTTPSGNIAAGCYLLGKYMADYKDPHKAAMAYNMGVAGAKNAWEAGGTSTDYSAAVVEAISHIDPDRQVPIEYGDGLRECKKMLMMAKAGKRDGYLLEGMACPGGCVAGAGTITPVKESAANVDRFKKAAPELSCTNSPFVSRLKEVEE